MTRSLHAARHVFSCHPKRMSFQNDPHHVPYAGRFHLDRGELIADGIVHAVGNPAGHPSPVRRFW